MALIAEYEGFKEITTVKILTRAFKTSETNINHLINVASHGRGYFKLGRTIVHVDTIVKKERKKTVKLIIKNEILNTKVLKPRESIIYIHKGKRYSSNEFAMKIGVSRESLTNRSKKYMSANINGLDVVIGREAHNCTKVFPYLYNGKDLHKNVTYEDIAEITGRTKNASQQDNLKGLLEKKTGFRIYDKDPTKGDK